MDNLSVLPDDVVFHILSFLPTKNSIRTSILSKRWKFQWAHVPCFGFTTTTDNLQFIMSLHNIVNAFHIGVGTRSNHELESWIETLLKRKVRVLVIGLNYQLTLPPRLFTSESLVYLRILDCNTIPEEDISVSFPALKKLELVNVGYDSEDPLPRLISGCKVLEELMFESVKVRCCGVYSPSLTRLVIDVDEVRRIQLDNPSLRYLRISARKCKNISARPLRSLIEADIDIVLNEEAINDPTSVIDFVNDLHNVKCLRLSTLRLDVRDAWFSQLMEHKFHNLTDLNLRADWRFITSFLENANNLRVLTIVRNLVDHNTQCWMEPKQVSECLTSHLETVTLVDFGWSAMHEFDLVKYILRNAKVLKKMDIICTRHYELDSNAKREGMKRIAMFEIGSPACHLRQA